MAKTWTDRPEVIETDAAEAAASLYGLSVSASELPSERDRAFQLITDASEKYILKIANETESSGRLLLEIAALQHLAGGDAEFSTPRTVPDLSGSHLARVDLGGQPHRVRLLTYLPGTPLGAFTPRTEVLLSAVGRSLGALSKALDAMDHDGAVGDFAWDYLNAATTVRRHIDEVEHRGVIDTILVEFESQTLPRLPDLRQSLLYFDANDHNVIVDDSDGEPRIGFIDFGDMIRGSTVGEVAICAAYGMLTMPDPLSAAAAVIRGYHEVFPLTEQEIELLYSLIRMRLATSVAIAAHRAKRFPDNAYLAISQEPAWEAIHRLERVHSGVAVATFRAACRLESTDPSPTPASLLAGRRRHLAGNLSVAYDEPLVAVRGHGAVLYDQDGRPHLDCVNNVAHVGHEHPKVVAAAQRQIGLLNTNSRYLHPSRQEYAARLAAQFPAPLDVVFLVNSGSEANDLALRLAWAHTGRRDMVVLDHAYHGNTAALIEASPYKHAGPGGAGRPAWVHVAAMPDAYRTSEGGDGQAHAAHVAAAVAAASARSRGPAGFLFESMPGVGGQIPMPDGYLQAAFGHVRAAGGLCIADEVQVGLGRVGSHFSAFELQDVVPDIVTLGKPLGNGHPLAAVITTREIADSFDNGMEYFNTFGGNPVSCAIGLAVLDVIEGEGLQDRAAAVGAGLMSALGELATRHEIIGDVRGTGLFIGVEFVRDRVTKEPASQEADHLINVMRTRSVLLSTDGPLHNVIKIKPPMVFSDRDAEQVVTELDSVLSQGL